MSGVHRAHQHRRSKRGLALALAALLFVALSFGAVSAFRALSGGCANSSEMTVAVDPALAPVVDRLVALQSASDLDCTDLAVEAVPSAAALAAVSGGKAPALWIPDSSLWLYRLGKATAQSPDIVSESIATTPVVAIGAQGDQPEVDTWLDVLRTKGLGLGDPLTSSVSAAPIIGSLAVAQAESSDTKVVTAAMVPIAQAQLSSDPETSQGKRIDEVMADGGTAVVTEQAVVSQPSGAVSTAVPKDGSVFLDFPMAVTEPSSGDHPAARRVGKLLAAVLSSSEAQAELSSTGFRLPNGAPLDDDRGVGKVAKLAPADLSAVSDALTTFARLALPIRALAVDDVSGSMAFPAGSTTRMALTIKASETGLGLFPGKAQLGLWSFSTKLDGNKDYKALVKIRRMDAEVGDTTQREIVLKAARSLKPKVGGGTGLYDTTLAAYREVKKAYDPKAINSVILLTDGANDDPGSISLKSLLTTLKEEFDPTRPVIIVTIGITADADAAVLKQISEATGGTSYIARTPADIANVFVTALQNRAG
ncbi:hypothetical protein C6I20_04575 [Aeromicrobium sp. A1-2]|uniref:substrate-binding domain-containing protein n=1 Tax=Aeromicrobium sp. A1-2 TaxID=2107713 RepID=UPI000E4F31F5|nr:substrate-binding domain-containing protein [Aeromicrobium sp. A1-2]AXT84542.1 hypothetical protein C6I20_04575 [Aeromicrobium sp. A1-2]